MARFQFVAAAVLLSVLMCLLVSSASAKSTSVRYCTKKGYPVQVSGVDINPYPVARGKPATFTIDASTDEPISSGKISIGVKYFGVHIHTEEHDLCEESTCPITAGKFVISHSQVLPGYTPPGSYNLEMTMVDQKNSELTCISFDFRIGFAADSVADS